MKMVGIPAKMFMCKFCDAVIPYCRRCPACSRKFDGLIFKGLELGR